MAHYTTTAICEGDYWVIDIPRVGTAHADTLDDVESGRRPRHREVHTAAQDVHIEVRVGPDRTTVESSALWGLLGPAPAVLA